VQVVSLKPNKDLAYLNDPFEAFRFFATGDHKGKITVIIP
jgi:hypothetical protein